MKNTELLLIGAGAALVAYLVASKAGAEAAAVVEEKRQAAALTISDWFADVLGLTAREDAILNDPDYARYHLALE